MLVEAVREELLDDPHVREVGVHNLPRLTKRGVSPHVRPGDLQ
jgi:hypothetical protein